MVIIYRFAGDDDIEELEEGEWVPDDPDFWRNLSEKTLDEGSYYLKLLASCFYTYPHVHQTVEGVYWSH